MRWINLDIDLSDIKAVETEQQHPYPIKKISRYLQNVKCTGIVLEENGKVKSYVIFKYLPHALRILRMTALNSKHEDLLLAKVLSKVTPYRRPKLIWDVPDHNLPLQVKLRDRFKFLATKSIKAVEPKIRFVYQLSRKYRKLYQGEEQCPNK